jgi:hypothetical protein
MTTKSATRCRASASFLSASLKLIVGLRRFLASNFVEFGDDAG